jgi:hypothetical protein
MHKYTTRYTLYLQILTEHLCHLRRWRRASEFAAPLNKNAVASSTLPPFVERAAASACSAVKPIVIKVCTCETRRDKSARCGTVQAAKLASRGGAYNCILRGWPCRVHALLEL